MKISGFTFIRNAVKYDFPIRECIASLLPLVDELVVNVGDCEDGTRALVRSIQESPGGAKIKVIENKWDDQKTKDGLVLSEQTNLALAACTGDWCVYLQADEALNERDLPALRSVLESVDSDTSIEAVEFPYFHFYAGYTLVQRPWNWYPKEIRAVRRSAGLESFGDAQTFRRKDGSRPSAHIAREIAVYHYGHAREPSKMAEKIRYFHRFWHGDAHGIDPKAAYQLDLRSLVWFWAKHPEAYRFRVEGARSWSPTPLNLVTTPIRTIVITGETPENSGVAGELREILAENQPRTWKVVTARGFTQWTKLVYKLVWSRKNTALVDLNAQGRGWLSFLYKACDSIAAFGWRVAYVPSGPLAKIRRNAYNAIAWGSHEEPEKGFSVPREEHAWLIAKWLGVEKK